MTTTIPLLRLPACALALALAACGGRPAPVDPAAHPPVADALPAPGAESAAAPGTAIPGGTSTWTCDDVTVNVAYDDVADTLTVSHADGMLVLPEQPGGDGMRFADDAGNQFHDTGDATVLSLAGQQTRNCTRQ